MIAKTVEKATCSNAKEFVKKWGLKEEFEKEYGINFAEIEIGANPGVSDQTIIHELLKDENGLYFVVYHPENMGHFEIFEIEIEDKTRYAVQDASEGQ